MRRAPKPKVDSDGLPASTSFRVLFRYRKAGRTRTYNLRVVCENDAELWVVSESGAERRSRKLVTFTDRQDAVPFLESVEQELRQGGWSELP